MGNFSQFHNPIKTVRVYSKDEQVFTENEEKGWSIVSFQWISVPFFNH